MKIKATLKGKEINFAQFVVFNKPEIEVEVDLPDEEVKIYSDDDLEKMSLEELAHLIWGGIKLTDEQSAHINRDYKELIVEALGEKYK